MNRYALMYVVAAGGLVLAASGPAAPADVIAPPLSAEAPGPALAALTLPSAASMLLWSPLLLALALLVAAPLWCLCADARKAAPFQPHDAKVRPAPRPVPATQTVADETTRGAPETPDA